MEGRLLRFDEPHSQTHDRQEYLCFRLGKRKIMALVTGYSIPLRAALNDSVPDSTNPTAAAEAWVEFYKVQQIAIAEGDEAIRFRACIGDKKTAPAMANASNLTQENKRLKKVK